MLADKELRLARQDELYRVQQREVSRLEVTIKRYALWGKLYNNEKFAQRAKTIQGRLDRMDKLDRPVLERRKMGLRLDGWRGSNKVLEISGLRKSFTNRLKQKGVLDGLDLQLWHGERVGLIGPNGAGKSVLLRLILAQEHPTRRETRRARSAWGPASRSATTPRSTRPWIPPRPRWRRCVMPAP